MTDHRLASGSPPVGYDDWQRLVQRTLQGAAADTLTRRTRDGIPVQPLYARGSAAGVPGAAPYTRGARAAGTSAGWDVRPAHAHPDPGRTNLAVLEDLEHGAGSAALVVDDGLARSGTAPNGVVLADLADLECALREVDLGLAPVALRAGARFAEAGALLLAHVERGGRRDGLAGLDLGADPIGAALAPDGAEAGGALAQATGVARHIAANGPASATALLADGRPWHAAGATEAQELAATVATAVAYLRALDEAGLAPDEGARQIAFVLATDADLFLSIAKLRALRRLWARVLEVAGAPDAVRGMRVHAETATRMLARRDPWVNILRGTVACLAAAAGGADSVTVLPFDHALGLPSRLARRIARNTQLILMEESSLHRVVDPAGGAGYVEALTEELAQRAWDLFRQIEAAGGMLAACRAGTPQAWVAASWAERARDVATRREPVTGVSEFPDLAEMPVEPEAFDDAAFVARARERFATAVVPESFAEALALAREGKALGTSPARSDLPPLPSHRLGEAFEALRDRSDRALARDGARPRVLLANLGPLAQHTARATFARNLLGAGGIEPVWSEPLTGGEAVASAFRAAGTRIAALCSSDEVYVDLAVEAARALKAAGCELVLLLGRPGERKPELEAAGVDLFVHAGRDMVEILTGLHDRLGTPAAETAP